jgi:hypothetical protein
MTHLRAVGDDETPPPIISADAVRGMVEALLAENPCAVMVIAEVDGEIVFRSVPNISSLRRGLVTEVSEHFEEPREE